MLLRLAVSTALLWASPLTAQPAPDPAFTGHYYLSGVMETGSELLLEPDGRFEWFLAYGAMDQFAKGRWERRGQTIALIADAPEKSRPLFALEAQQPWNARAEEALREVEESMKRRAIEERCAFLQNDVTTTVAAIPMPGATPPPGAGFAAKAALAVAVEKRGVAEAAMAAAIATPTEAANATASKATLDWRTARSEAAQSFYTAGQDMPALEDAKIPVVCGVPPYVPQDVESPATWRRGVAVVLGDPEVGSRFSSIMVTFRYADGSEATDVTNMGGWAVARPRKSVSVEAVTLSFPDADPPLAAVSLPLKPMREGVQPVRFDSRQLAGTPFQTMILRIDGKYLLPERGRYSRP